MEQGYVELEIEGVTFRIRKERTLLADSQLEKVFYRDKALGAHDVIKVDCEIFDRKTSKWFKVTDEDLEKISRIGGRELIAKINELRDKEKDFHKTQPKKQKSGSGS